MLRHRTDAAAESERKKGATDSGAALPKNTIQLNVPLVTNCLIMYLHTRVIIGQRGRIIGTGGEKQCFIK